MNLVFIIILVAIIIIGFITITYIFNYNKLQEMKKF